MQIDNERRRSCYICLLGWNRDIRPAFNLARNVFADLARDVSQTWRKTMRAVPVAIAASAAILSASLLTSTRADAIGLGASVAARAAIETVDPVEKTGCLRHGWRGWGWYHWCGYGYYHRPYYHRYGYYHHPYHRWGYGYGY